MIDSEVSDDQCLCDYDYTCPNHDWDAVASEHLPSYMHSRGVLDDMFVESKYEKYGFGVDELLSDL